MPTICAGVSAAGALDGVLFETAMTSVSSANGKDLSPACVSAAFCCDDERAKSMSVLLPAPYRVDFPAPEPFGRAFAPLGSGMLPPPVAAKVATRTPVGSWPLALAASANSLTACWLVSEPTTSAAWAAPAEREMALAARVAVATPAKNLRTDILVRFL